MRSLRIVASLALLVILAGAVSAADEAKKEKKKKGTAAAGVIEKVDASGKSITVRTGKKNDPTATSVTITFTDSTKFLIRDEANPKGRDAKLSDMATGKRANVQFEEKDGKKIATTVLLIEAKKKKDK